MSVQSFGNPASPQAADSQPEPVQVVIRYHQETKHHFFRYARSLGYLDWANQPDPFRRYEGAPLVPLPILKADEEPLSPAYDDLYQPGRIRSQPVTLRTLSRFFEYALALSAWKEAGGTRWALRSNPSSGNLHPTEGYLVVDGIPGLLPTPGIYHYAPKEHALELRGELSSEAFWSLMKGFPLGAFLVALTSIHWREAWKYGERAYRYCQHDVGHALGTTRVAAATLGWKMVLLEDVGDDLTATLLGINRKEDYLRAEPEYPDCIAVVWPADSLGGTSETDSTRPVALPLSLDTEAVRAAAGGLWHGKANRLSRRNPDPWELIEIVTASAWKPDTGPRHIELLSPSSSAKGEEGKRLASAPSAGQIIRQRRSALAFDGRTSIPAERFYVMLDRVMPRSERTVAERPMPWDAIPWEPAVHLVFFIHLVDGIQPGLYALVRDLSKVNELRRVMHDSFVWSTPPECPDNLPFFLLQEGDVRQLAAQVSCHQDIAGDGCFSLGMIAEFESTLRRHGPWSYRRLFWETGVIGQVLYLEAEAAGVRGTGIGCFFDDPVHQVFGLKDVRFQSLYHFTVGGPVEDPRLTTLPPYGSSAG